MLTAIILTLLKKFKKYPQTTSAKAATLLTEMQLDVYFYLKLNIILGNRVLPKGWTVFKNTKDLES